MNVFIAVLLCFSLLGALDEALGGKIGVAEEFRRGLAAMGPLTLSMAGICCAAEEFLPAAAQTIAKLPLGFDASLPAGVLIATDMGAWAGAQVLAASPELAVYSGLLVASTLGCLVSFVLPVTLGTLKQYEITGYMQGVVWGVTALPFGLLPGALTAGLSVRQIVYNLLPVAALCILLCVSLRLAPRGCLRVLAAFGTAVRWLGIILFCAAGFGLFVPEHRIISEESIAKVLIIILKITIVVCGSLTAGRIVTVKCGRWLDAASKLLGVNEYAVLGLIASLVSSISMLPFYSRMDVRGKVMNAAFTVSGSFILGGQMAFAAAAADGRALAAYFAAKICGGVLAVVLALRFTKAEPLKE